MIAEPFYLGKYPVTQQQFEMVMGHNPNRSPSPDRPVNQMSFYEAVEFCKNVSVLSDARVRLCTETEYEFACRAGTNTAFYTGDTVAAAQILLGISKKGPTGVVPPNAFGFYDMLVQTYCQDPVYVIWTTDPKAWKVVPADTPGALARRGCAVRTILNR